MEPVWFVLVAVMIIAYVVLDGFDLGAGVLHLLIVRTEEERVTVIRTIGRVWDGNEVWLIAAGGTLYFAFPALYASSFSGFYLPLNIVLWLLMLRAVGIEFRLHLESPVWRGFFDGAFWLASALLGIFFGAALGNVILDWYTVLCGALALVAVTVHGTSWVTYKTAGVVQARARKIAAALLVPLFVLAA